jgi:hypothetical protein
VANAGKRVIGSGLGSEQNQAECPDLSGSEAISSTTGDAPQREYSEDNERLIGKSSSNSGTFIALYFFHYAGLGLHADFA